MADLIIVAQACETTPLALTTVPELAAGLQAHNVPRCADPEYAEELAWQLILNLKQ